MAKHNVIKGEVDPREFSIRVEGIEPDLKVVYVKFRKGQVFQTITLDEEVYADYDRSGNLLGVEFAEPEAYDIRLMAEISKKVKEPILSGISPRKLAVPC